VFTPYINTNVNTHVAVAFSSAEHARATHYAGPAGEGAGKRSCVNATADRGEAVAARRLRGSLEELDPRPSVRWPGRETNSDGRG
jgi:hypothetical protein